MGFWSDTTQLRQIIERKLKEGRGRDALREAVEEQRGLPRASNRPKRSYKKVFLISLIAGVLWQSGKRTRR